jgi:hypothetical protein
VLHNERYLRPGNVTLQGGRTIFVLRTAAPKHPPSPLLKALYPQRHPVHAPQYTVEVTNVLLWCVLNCTQPQRFAVTVVTGHNHTSYVRFQAEAVIREFMSSLPRADPPFLILDG